MAKHRTHSIEFKRQVAQDFIAGETLHSLAKRHDISRNLIRMRVKKLGLSLSPSVVATNGPTPAVAMGSNSSQIGDYLSVVGLHRRCVGRNLSQWLRALLVSALVATRQGMSAKFF